MKEILIAAEEISQKMKEKGYEYFNVKHGISGSDLKTGIAAYLQNASINNTEPVFPIYAGSRVAASSPDKPYTWATFKIVADDQKGLRIDKMGISMYACYEGSLKQHIEFKIKSPNDIPSRLNAAKLIEDNQLPNSKKPEKVVEIQQPIKMKSRKI
ncbi:hypothetical protein [Polluticaenibacter yanchengensis]|uniref:Uncharacterized protein n=1 Tax=Polluticaenibacter yanchengensis TaxID=3014562 RepID=A0ABT4UF96_9BACT|nr:hypothetical protein [Chitinophagaceae bacterium LY-5]